MEVMPTYIPLILVYPLTSAVKFELAVKFEIEKLQRNKNLIV